MAEASDADLLRLLAMRDAKWSQRKMALELGMTRNQVAGLLRRIDRDLADAERRGAL